MLCDSGLEGCIVCAILFNMVISIARHMSADRCEQMVPSNGNDIDSEKVGAIRTQLARSHVFVDHGSWDLTRLGVEFDRDKWLSRRDGI
ncbi:hypothetical protein B0T17DRAFT_603557 [Bombardia bombarda]|uniref:Uncharacterized protein n=1 Tax=Bombardia bombarda TaxID=252184 RepID=A0AA39TRB4_9PEZI|nr:hypothetical protein B0T17DRAFT_603557 [Bombardia bombarda]